MRIVRFSSGQDPQYGLLDGEEITPLAGDSPFGRLQPAAGSHYRLAEIRLLAPVEPGKIVSAGRNYAEHAAELGNEVPEEPLVFLKPGTSVIGPGDDIVHPPYCSELHYEGELAVVIGRRCRGLTPDEVPKAVFGYTCANDVTARDLQKRDGQWWRAKGSDTFCPLGPWVETELDPADAVITTMVNGEVRQTGNTKQMVHDIADLITYISSAMTLLPGDVILTGTPAGVGRMRPGDQVIVSVTGIGELNNRVVAG
ncbi:MAG: fumarylacetoacetate hydrolase family protein [Pseudonocardiaceae bacterium]